MYRFARTYGFINLHSSRSSEHGQGGKGGSSLSLTNFAPKDSIRVNPDRQLPLVQTTPDGVVVPGSAGVLARGAGGQFPSFSVEVKLGDARNAVVSEGCEGGSFATGAVTGGPCLPAANSLVGTAGDLEESVAEPTSSALSASGAAIAPATAEESSASASIAAAAAACDALEKRLCRYPTTLEEDLALLRRYSFGVNKEDGEKNDQQEGGDEDNDTTERVIDRVAPPKRALPGAVTTEWVEMCVNVRAAEKIALRRALRENNPSTPAQ